MSSSKFCRRSFLKALGVSTVLLPILDVELEGGARADAPGAPKRFAAVLWPNGVTNNYWPSNTDEMNWQPSSVLAPLAPHRADILVLDGIDNRAMIDQFPDYGGHAALPYMLTGGPGKHPDNSDLAAIGDAISLDQYLARSQSTPFKSLVIGVDNREETDPTQKYWSFSGPAIGNQPNAPAVQDDVHKLYASLFAGSGMNPAYLQQIRAERKSVLDYVGADLERFKKRVGKESGQKIDLHLQSIRNLESRLDQIPSTTYQPKPDDPTIDPYNKDHYDRIARAQVDLVVGAFASGQTNLATLMWSNGHNNSWVFKWLGGDYGQPGDGSFNPLRSHHEMAHRGGDGSGGDADAQRKDGVDTYFQSLFAYFIDSCKKVQELGVPMLDHCVLLFANNMGNGASHSNTRLPWLLAGKCGGAFRTGRYVKVPGTPHNRVLVSIGNAMGDSMTSFGPAMYGGALGQLA